MSSNQNIPQSAKGSRWKLLRPLGVYLRRYRRGVIVGFLMLLCYRGFDVAFPLVLGRAIDVIKQQLTREALAHYALLLIALTVGKGFFLFWMRWILIGVSRDIEYDLRNDLFAHLEKLTPRFYVQNRTGELMSRCTNDLSAVRMLLGPGIMYSANTVVAFAAAIPLMLHLSWRLTLFLLIPIPLVSLAVRHFGRAIHDRFAEIQASLAAISARVQENLAGVRVVRAFCQEEAELESFQNLNREYIERNRRLIRVQSMFYPALMILIGVTYLMVLWYGGRQVLAGRLTIGMFTAFTGYLFMLSWPMIALGWVVNLLERGSAAMGRIQYILESEPEIADRPRPAGAPAAEPIRGEIEFRKLSFSYNAVPILKNISLKIAAGETVAIVGPTGCGKSTLVSLIARLYDAPEGALWLDGRPITDYPIGELRRAIGFVPQETFLFSETVGENIAFGLPDVSPEAVEKAAEIASIHGDVEDFPRKFDTMVGERGITLSGGQKQRTALARAILRDPKILILDDALSSVDTQTEEKILRRLAEILRLRTTILISHRVSTVRHADQIVVLRHGEIAERGTHEELIERGGYYYDLDQKQLLEEELESA
ncbi:MAG TPA: ABC transporter ATP-binding protein [Candidatus Acidoferrales bacterium]